MKEQITKILISQKEQQREFNISNMALWNSQRTLVGRNRPPHTNLSVLEKITRIQQLEIAIQGRFFKKQVRLPNEIQDRLVEYFKYQPDQMELYDCVSFVYFIKRMPYEYGNFDINQWNFTPIKNERILRIGDVILITEGPLENLLFRHMAIYIGDGIYMSKFGTTGGIIFATLEEMNTGFSGNTAFLAKSNAQQVVLK